MNRIPLSRFDTFVTPFTANELLLELNSVVQEEIRFVVANHNLHSLYINLTNPAFNTYYQKFNYILIDGFPVLWLAKRQRGHGLSLSRSNRIGSLDWVPRIGEVDSLRRVAVVGAAKNANFRAVQELGKLHPHLVVSGLDGEDWGREKAGSVVQWLNEFRPQVTVVGLGMPLQEEFLSENWEDLPNAVYATVGGAIDQIAGVQKAAPRWIARFNAEWLWRLMTQPRRLSHRYLLEPWLLCMALVKRSFKGRLND